MLLGIGFVTVITAAITSSFVTRSRQQQQTQPLTGNEDHSVDHLRRIDERLERIEAALSRHL